MCHLFFAVTFLLPPFHFCQFINCTLANEFHPNFQFQIITTLLICLFFKCAPGWRTLWGDVRWAGPAQAGGHWRGARAGRALSLLASIWQLRSAAAACQTPGSAWDINAGASASPGPWGAHRLDNCPSSLHCFASESMTNGTWNPEWFLTVYGAEIGPRLIEQQFLINFSYSTTLKFMNSSSSWLEV